MTCSFTTRKVPWCGRVVFTVLGLYDMLLGFSGFHGIILHRMHVPSLLVVFDSG